MSLRARDALLTLPVVLMFLIVGAPADAARRGPKAPHCAGGYFLIDGAPLVAGAGGPDALVVGLGGASTSSGCPARKANTFRPKGGKKKIVGDELVVHWPACGTLRKASLQAVISPDCATVSGVFKAKGAKRRKFTGRDGLPAGLREPWDGTGLPLGSTLVTPAEFLTASGEPGFRLFSSRLHAADEVAAAAADAANRETLAAFAAANPARASFVSTGVDPSDPDLRRTADGNYLLTVYDADGNGTDVVTQGPRYQRAVLAETIRRFPTKENQLAIYAQRYDFAKANLDPSLPPPDEVAGRSAEEIAALNGGVAAQYPAAEAASPLPGEEVSASYPARCGLEIGFGDGTDGPGFCKHTTDGLWNTATWPLKYFDTCTRSQAVRGTCVAFAITAGREIRVAKKYDRWIDLSEQQLYFTAKQSLQPTNYGDGLGGASLLTQLFDTGYQQPLERQWDYNPSSSRLDDKANKAYSNSCVGYGGDQVAFCSDTAGQGRIICMQTGAGFTCATQGAPVVGTTVRSIEQPAELWDASDPVASLTNVIWTLRVAQIPVLLSFPVVRTFDGPDVNGYVRFRGDRQKVCATVAPGDPAFNPATDNCIQTADCECSRGGHAVVAVGYLPEKTLPETAPKGSGGYLIIKNSWGCSGDGGYYYLPAGWVRAFVNGARPIGDVETSAPLPEQPFDPTIFFDYKPVPPTIHIVQPAIGENYVAGQGIPLVLDGADFQYERWALLGTTRWTSNLQGLIAQGQNAVATLTEGTHTITASYTGKLGTTVTAVTSIIVGPRPADLPPTAFFFDYTILPGNQCPVSCGYDCIVGFGQGNDPEDGALRSDASVRWYSQILNNSQQLSSTGASTANQGKFLVCARLCGGLFKFTLQVEDSKGQIAESRRELFTSDCVN